MFRRTTRQTPTLHRPVRLPLRLERLEDRTVPSQYLWTDTGNGNWNNPNNWDVVSGTDGGFPNAAGDSAVLGNAISANSTITIPDGITITVGSITIDDNNNYTIAAAGTGRLTINALAGNAALTVSNSNGNGSHTISAPIFLVDNLDVTVPSSAVLTMSGPITSALPVGLGMTGPGTLRLGGSADNTYTGATTVRSGTLELNKTGGADAFRGNLVVGDGNGAIASAVLRNTQNENIPNGSTVTVNSDGQYDLNGFTEHFGPLAVIAGRVNVGGGTASFPALTMTGGTMSATTAGVIELLGNATINASAAGATMNGTGELYLGGGLGATRTFAVADDPAAAIDLNISLEVRASSFIPAGLAKAGPGVMRLGGPSTFAGNVTLTAGTLLVGNDTALGTGTFVINGGTVQADGVARTLANRVTVGGDFTVGAPLGLTFTGVATLTGDRTITVPGNATFAGQITEDSAGRSLTKTGLGSLRLSGAPANTYTGMTKVVEGTLFLNKAAGVAAFGGNLEVGDDVPGPAMVFHDQGNNIPDTATVTVKADGLYRLFNQTEAFSSLVVNGGTADVNTGTLIISALSMTGGSLTAAGSGQVQLNGNVTPTISAAGGATVNGGHVQMGNAVRTYTVTDGPAAVDLGVDSEIRGTAGLLKSGPGTMALVGGISNTYSGPTTVSGGVLVLNKNGRVGAAVAVPAELTINGGAVREEFNDQIADTAIVNVNVGGRFDLNGQSDTVGPVTVTGGTLATSGLSAGRLTAGNTSFNAAGTLAMNLVDATNSDRITANGTVAVGGALQLNLASAVATGTAITLIDNDGTDAVAGTFNGLPEGALVTIGGQTFSISYAGGTGNDVVLTRVNPPQVASFRVNDGSAQRSMVTSLTVTFSSQVTLGTGAFTLVPQGGGTPVALSLTTAVVNGVTVATITFPGATGGSLADGRYVLTTVAAHVRDLAGTPMAGDRQDALFRLFGDVNGDAAVNGLDLTEFRKAFGSTSADAAYVSALDFNGDGVINGTDLTQFRSRFGVILP